MHGLFQGVESPLPPIEPKEYRPLGDRDNNKIIDKTDQMRETVETDFRDKTTLTDSETQTETDPQKFPWSPKIFLVMFNYCSKGISQIK